MGSAPSLLSIVSVTSARPSAGRPDVPAKTTSSILPPRSGLTPCSPITQENASTTLDLPEPFGPTMHVMPGSNLSVVADANDLNPRKVRVFRYTCRLLPCLATAPMEHAMTGGHPRQHLTASQRRPCAFAPVANPICAGLTAKTARIRSEQMAASGWPFLERAKQCPSTPPAAAAAREES